jgi:hypothetical protein
MAHALVPTPIFPPPSTPEPHSFPSDLNARSCRYVWAEAALSQALSISADSRTVLEVMPRKIRLRKEDVGGHREEVLNSLTRVIGAIDTVKDLVPIAIGKSILSAASTILLVVRVNPWSIIETGR